MVRVRAKHLAFIREEAGVPEEELELGGDATPLDFLREIVNRYPGLKKYLLEGDGSLKKGIRVAVNAEIVPREELGKIRLRDGDEVAIIPPIAGGAPYSSSHL